MRVLVTGGRGKVGAEAARALSVAGHRVTVTDMGPASYGLQPAGTLPYIRADLTDYGAAIGTVMKSAPEVVVHAAGIPDPQHDPASVIFANNTLANFNVAEAVARAGVGRLVYLSSETVAGFVTAERPVLPEYLPVDEDHPRRPQDAYALSKAMGEDICDALVRRSDATVVSIRPSFVLNAVDYANVLPRFRARPAIGQFNYWSYVDVVDLADLIVLTVGQPTPGHQVVYAAQPDNLLGQPFVDLVRTALGATAPPLRRLEREDSGGISIAKARKLFGWDPKRSWRDYDVGR